MFKLEHKYCDWIFKTYQNALQFSCICHWRWLISNDKHQQAQKTIRKAAAWNKVTVSDHLMNMVPVQSETATEENSEPEEDDTKYSLRKIKASQLKYYLQNIPDV